MSDITDAIEALKGRVSQRIASIISQLDTTGGQLATTTVNIALVSDLLAEMQRTMLDDEFIVAVADYLAGFDAIGIDAVAAMADFGEIDPAITDAITEEFKRINATELLTPTTYSQSVFTPIANDLLLGIATGAAIDTVIDAAVGRVESLSDPIDALVGGSEITLQRTLTTTIAEQVGVEFFYFQGRPIASTRDWCREREGHAWHIEEIRKWGRDAASGVDTWAGMVEGTDETSIFVHVGGYYGKRQTCRHVLTPVDIMDVPPEDLARMKKKGLVN
jgi:hypothetical protein